VISPVAASTHRRVATGEASILKVKGSEAMNFCPEEALGGYGYIEEYHLIRAARL